jgi:hypothetical protein
MKLPVVLENAGRIIKVESIWNHAMIWPDSVSIGPVVLTQTVMPAVLRIAGA